MELLARCRNDPDLFNTAILDRPPYWSGVAKGFAGQREWCQDLIDYRCLAIETGNAVGKDYWVGGIIPWWLWTRKNSLVIVTGPGQSLIGSVTWKEVRKAIENARFKMGGSISRGIKTSPHTVTLGTDWQALGYSTTSVERASGQHNKNLLVIVEEASGVEDEAWDAINSLGYSKLVAIFNPLKPDGGAVALCDQAAKDHAAGLPPSVSVCHRNVPSTAGPDAEKDESDYGLACKVWLDEVERKYGRDSWWYRSHVLAIRPTMSHEALIPVEHLDRCIAPETANLVAELRRRGLGGKKRIGCDVGEGCGNARTVVWVRDDLGVLELHASAYTGTSGAAEIVGKLAMKHSVKEADTSYDAAGQTGKRMKNALEALGLGRAVGYFGSDSGGRWCSNLRTAASMALARRLDPSHFGGVGKPWLPFYIPPTADWPATRDELLALRYQLKGDKTALELKEDMMERLGRSPDYADALAQTFRDDAIRG